MLKQVRQCFKVEDVEVILYSPRYCIALKGLHNGHIEKTLNENDSQ